MILALIGVITFGLLFNGIYYEYRVIKGPKKMNDITEAYGRLQLYRKYRKYDQAIRKVS